MQNQLSSMLPPHWSKLSRFRENKIIASMYVWIFIVPVFAKLFSELNDVATVTIFEYTFQLPLDLPFSWKAFYFSALSFAIANLVYTLRCPALIKENPNYSRFRNEARPEWHLREYAEELSLDFQQTKEDLKVNLASHNETIDTTEEFTHRLFWHLFWKADRFRTGSFYVSQAFYIIGFLLIGAVIIQNLIWVIELMIR